MNSKSLTVDHVLMHYDVATHVQLVQADDGVWVLDINGAGEMATTLQEAADLIAETPTPRELLRDQQIVAKEAMFWN
jgi:hypothetical protein